ncbi:MULE domain-containing protein, partial [Aphis craccivora]
MFIIDMPSNNQIVQFCYYLTENYVQDVFPPSLWASKPEVLTNDKKIIKNSYKFLIDDLHDIQVYTYIKFRSVEGGVIQERNKMTTQTYKFSNIQQYMKEDEQISRYEFLNKVCFKNKRQNVNF